MSERQRRNTNRREVRKVSRYLHRGHNTVHSKKSQVRFRREEKKSIAYHNLMVFFLPLARCAALPLTNKGICASAYTVACFPTKS
jgi:hypothetical protein